MNRTDKQLIHYSYGNVNCLWNIFKGLNNFLTSKETFCTLWLLDRVFWLVFISEPILATFIYRKVVYRKTEKGDRDGDVIYASVHQKIMYQERLPVNIN